VKDENAALGPPPVVTITSTAPMVRTGVIQVIVVLFTMLNEVADIPPNVRDVAPVKLVPRIVTLVPSRVLPDNGEMLLITGGVI
jgi:hypothetical protein